MKKDEKNLGADAAEVDTARSAESEVARKHTPGPWTLRLWMVETATGKIANVSNDGGRYVMAEQGRIALVDCQTDFKRGQGHLTVCAERDANAHLIAAAPDLLEALTGLLEAVMTTALVEPGRVELAQAAISKTQGQE